MLIIWIMEVLLQYTKVWGRTKVQFIPAGFV